MYSDHIIRYKNNLKRVWDYNKLFLFPLKYISGLIFLLVLIGKLSGQGNTVISYGQEEGLCGQNYTSSCFDSKGSLWVGSSTGGVSKFDGSRWKRFFTQDGLISNVSYGILSDESGNVFVNHNEFGISLIRNDTIVQFPIRTIEPSAREGFRMINIKREVYLINFKSKLMYKFDVKKQKFVHLNNTLLDRIKNIKPRLSGVVFFDSIDTLVAFENNNIGIISIAMFNKYKKEPIINYEFKAPFIFRIMAASGKHRMTFQTNSYLLISDEKALRSYRPKTLELNGRKINIKVNQLMTIYTNTSIDISTGIWSLEGSNEYLITEYDNTSGKIVSWFKYKSDYRPQSLNKDVAGTYWILTENNVQRVLPYQMHIPFGTSKLQPQTWATQQGPNGDMWFASYQNGFSYYDGWSMQDPPPYLVKKAFFYDGSFTDSNGNMYFNWAGNMETKVLGGGIMKFDGVGKCSFSNIGTIGFMINEGKNGEILWGTASKGLWIKPKGKKIEDDDVWMKIDSSKGMFLTNVLCAIEDNHGKYWMGRSSQGISVFDKKTGKAYNFFKEKTKEMFGLMGLAEDHHGNLWFGTDRGLYFFQNNKKIDENFDILKHSELIAKETIGNSLVNICKIYDKHSLIVGNMTGYFLLDLDSFYLKKRKISFNGVFKKNNANYPGGQANQNGGFIDRDSQIWIPTSNGVFRHDPRLFIKDTSSISVIVDSIKVGDNVQLAKDFGDCIELNSNENSIIIYFNRITNRFLYDNIWYRYRLNDNEWSDLTKSNFASYINLESNVYSFQVQAMKNGEFSDVYSIKFRVDSPWWQKWWFWLLISGVVSGVGIFLFMKQNESKNQQIQIAENRAQVEIISKEKSKLQIEAITNQLNPHFINNALQWLQVRIDADVEAVEVVDKLSENISTVFKNSRNKINFHPLKDELRLTENYLFIQKARFGERLHISTPAIEDIHRFGNYNVPLMIIQIHTENAVEHGIRNKKDGKGVVSISIEDGVEYFKIMIEDDGVGRSVAQSIGSKGTQNGTKMLNELEKIYNEINELKMSQVYEDRIFLDPDGTAYGTRMNILIPKSFNFTIE